jgi:hypothetical protein
MEKAEGYFLFVENYLGNNNKCVSGGHENLQREKIDGGAIEIPKTSYQI